MFTPDPNTEYLPCRDEITEDWFSGKEDSRATVRALDGCRRCPLRLQCETESLEFEAKLGYTNWGIYGGLTERQRRKILKTGRKPHARRVA